MRFECGRCCWLDWTLLAVTSPVFGLGINNTYMGNRKCAKCAICVNWHFVLGQLFGKVRTCRVAQVFAIQVALFSEFNVLGCFLCC